MQNDSSLQKSSLQQKYLTCERLYIFELLIMAAGMMGAYTFNLRGGVFCNAQTANVVLMAMAFGKGEITRGLYYLIPLGISFAVMLAADRGSEHELLFQKPHGH